MTDDNTSHLVEEQIDRQRRGMGHGGAVMDVRDPRLSSIINWVWTALGGIALLIGIGMYNKLSSMNDTLLVAVSKLETQGNQINDLRAEMMELRKDNASMRTQIAVIEGKVQRGIQEIVRGH